MDIIDYWVDPQLIQNVAIGQGNFPIPDYNIITENFIIAKSEARFNLFIASGIAVGALKADVIFPLFILRRVASLLNLVQPLSFKLRRESESHPRLVLLLFVFLLSS